MKLHLAIRVLPPLPSCREKAPPFGQPSCNTLAYASTPTVFIVRKTHKKKHYDLPIVIIPFISSRLPLFYIPGAITAPSNSSSSAIPPLPTRSFPRNRNMLATVDGASSRPNAARPSIGRTGLAGSIRFLLRSLRNQLTLSICPIFFSVNITISKQRGLSLFPV